MYVGRSAPIEKGAAIVPYVGGCRASFFVFILL